MFRVSVFVKFSVYLVDWRGLFFGSGNVCPKASQTCCDSIEIRKKLIIEFMRLANPSARSAVCLRLFRFWSYCYHAEWKSLRVNLAYDLMNSLAFFIQHDHHEAIAEKLSPSFFTRFWLVRYFHLLASFFRKWCQTICESFEKPRHGSLAQFYIRFYSFLKKWKLFPNF